MHTKEYLSPHAKSIFTLVKKELPEKISKRLKSMRGFGTHGSYNDFFGFDIWDKKQTDVINRYHFKYTLNYQPNRPIHDGSLQLWLNRIRIYNSRSEILELLDRELPSKVPTGFSCQSHYENRAINIAWDFRYPKQLCALDEMVVPMFVKLISSCHPILMPIIDQFSVPLADGERTEVVTERGRIPFDHPGVRDSARVREYTRSIPPSWKQPILQRYGYRCSICNSDLRVTKYHFDHILAFSRGGKTTLENLQPLCEQCNLKKGNR